MFEIIPAIDLKGGQCVRLLRGAMDQATVYGGDPAAMARRWRDEGATRLHVVDLDGAVGGSPANFAAVEAIARGVDIPIDVGGGIRGEEVIRRYLDAGARWLVLGTVALERPGDAVDWITRHPGVFYVGIDARNSKVATRGWVDQTAVDAADLARRFISTPLAGFIYTDIHRDGASSGVNLRETVAFAAEVRRPVIASGGVGSLEDLRELMETARNTAITGVIAGRALYEGSLSLKEALRLAAEFP
ncbi:MAG: 1-(5-phosphoribosyl)-5-[(5-phosphoribosylamino)methylideneamino] imidazole-4-carboxamide isomerase [Myxococcota bacterium]|nr:1-(5-phosphoribosyl)-5-[(5-phosphoribosylamino)methylideneamino] imidazole-4-carboxamide isomerase [Myxococcota bacterium]